MLAIVEKSQNSLVSHDVPYLSQIIVCEVLHNLLSSHFCLNFLQHLYVIDQSYDVFVFFCELSNDLSMGADTSYQNLFKQVAEDAFCRFVISSVFDL